MVSREPENLKLYEAALQTIRAEGFDPPRSTRSHLKLYTNRLRERIALTVEANKFPIFQSSRFNPYQY